MAYQDDIVRAGLHCSTAKAISGSVQVGITAAGATQATAYALKQTISVIATAAAGTGVILPRAVLPADSFVVFNGGANALLVYPPVGGTINGGAANAAVSLATLKGAVIVAVTPLIWIAVISA